MALSIVHEGDLRVWHIPQIPMKAFHIPVSTPEDAIRVMRILAEYDMFEYKNNVKDDYFNAQGLEVFEDGEWVDWYNEDGDGIDDYAELLTEEA